MIQRNVTHYLHQWKNEPEHLPLLLRGARQVGKTFTIEQFGHNHFEYFVHINFELDPDFADCFQTLKPQEIITRISLKQSVPIIPGKTLLFLDEIQNCPAAISSLRYFKEQMPALHVVGAGSLLEFALNELALHMPVGRIQYLYMYPLTFNEYLLARQKNNLIECIKQSTLSNPIPTIAHQELLKLAREYFILGGMPAVVDHYIKYQNLITCQHLQSALLLTYRDDFGKYAKKTQFKYVQLSFNKIPYLIGKQIKYSHIDPDSLSRNIKEALTLLEQAGILYKVYSSSCSGFPLNAVLNEKKFKLILVDIGLTNRASKTNIQDLMENNLTLVNQGALAEQLVGQELLASQDPYDKSAIYFWARDKEGSQAEVDYVIQLNSKLIPIEVKSGKIGKLRSLKQLMTEKNIHTGIKISQEALSMRDHILSIPFYMISELPRLVI